MTSVPAAAAVVWLADIGSSDHFAALAPPDTRRRNSVDRERSEVGAGLLRWAAAHCAGVSIEGVGIRRLRSGRPMLSGVPLHGSISHAGSTVAVAIAAKPIGVDVEPANRLVDVAGLRELLGLIRPQNEPTGKSEVAAFLAGWTRAEARAKVLSTHPACLFDVEDGGTASSDTIPPVVTRVFVDSIVSVASSVLRSHEHVLFRRHADGAEGHSFHLLAD